MNRESYNLITCKCKKAIFKTLELLNEYNTSLVLHDIPKSRNESIHASAKFVYLRFHGPTGDYRGSYSNAFLKEQAHKIASCVNEGKDVYAYFNNTIGSAFENARTLQMMTGQTDVM